MSRREGRDSHGKRLHSTRFDRQPSPKRSRRDEKPATERKYSNRDILEITEQIDSDQKHPRRFQDTLLLEANPAPGSKAQSDVLNKKLEKKADAFSDAVKHSSDPADVPRSRSYFQHDERGSAGQSDRSFGRRATEKRGLRPWDVPREQSSGKTKEKATSKDLQLKEEKVTDVHRRDKSQTRLDDGIWRHDKCHELAVDAPPARRRPAFREHKLPTEDLAASEKQPETVKPSFHQRPGSGSAKREEQGGYPHGQERAEKTFTGADDRTTGWEDRSLRWGEMREPVIDPGRDSAPVAAVEGGGIVTMEDMERGTKMKLVVPMWTDGSMISLMRRTGAQPQRMKRMRLPNLKLSWHHRA